MIQVEETEGLGAGQKIETEMAKQVNLKIFRTYTNSKDIKSELELEEHRFNGMAKISKAVQEWCKNDCTNMDLENVFVGNPLVLYTLRPRHENLQNSGG